MQESASRPASGLGGRLFLLLLPLLLVLPLDPEWPDFERARRGLFMLLVGLGLCLPPWRRSRVRAPWLLPLGLLPLLSLLSLCWARDPLAGVEPAAYLAALVLLPVLLGEEGHRSLLQGLGLALFLTLCLGLAQALGLHWPYGRQTEPVSTLGNLNVATEWVAAASPLSLLLGWMPGLLNLVLADVFLWLNAGGGGRAALIGFHLALLVVLLKPAAFGLGGRHRTGLLLLLALVPALVLSWPDREPLSPGMEGQAEPGRGDTIGVRLRLYPAAFHLIREEMPLGAGAGNFRVVFPRYRDPEEIRISSLGGRIVTRVTTAHCDPLQILAELGLCGGFLLLWFLWVGGRALREGELGWPAVSAFLAFLPLTLFRSALWNAPAALCLLAGLLSGRRKRGARLPAALAPLLGLLLLVPGSVLLAGETSLASFLREREWVRAPDRSPSERQEGYARILKILDLAVGLDPLETDGRLLRAQLLRRNLERKDLPRLLADLAEVLDRRPFEYQALAEVGALGLLDRDQLGDRASELARRGRRAVEKLCRLYPGHPLGLAMKKAYAGTLEGRLARALEGLRDPALHEAGKALMEELMAGHPEDPRVQELSVRYLLREARFEEALTLLEESRDKELLQEVRRMVGSMIEKTEGRLLLDLMKFENDLRTLGRRLFPGEFK